MAQWRQHLRGEHAKEEEEAGSEAAHKPKSASSDCYDLPCGMAFMRRWTIFKFVPFCPMFLADLKSGGQTTNDDNDVEGAGVTAVSERRDRSSRGSEFRHRSMHYQRRMSVVMQF